MKLLEIIKTKNGLAFLSNKKQHIINSYLKLDMSFPSYKPDFDYGESTFSYKAFVKNFPKTIGSNLRDVLSRLQTKGGNRELIHLLYRTEPVIDFDGDCIDVELDGDISFTPYNKLPHLLNGGFDEKGRQKMSTFKFFKKIVPAYITEQQVKEFVELIYADVTLDLSLEFVRGKEIAVHYNKIDTAGWSKTSCMTKRELERFQLYTDNPETIELGVIKNGKEIVGRFLRWKTDELGWVEDTLYYKTYPVFSWFKARGIAENSWRKITNVHFINNKDSCTKRLHVSVVKPKTAYNDYTTPYLDTFRGCFENKLHNQA